MPSLLNTEELVRIGTLLKNFCLRKGILRPRIALAALNPHAGEHGAFGDEDGTIIAPAVERLGVIHPDAEFDGPSVPDCVYRDAVEGNYDAVLAPYHDQGRLPAGRKDGADALTPLFFPEFFPPHLCHPFRG